MQVRYYDPVLGRFYANDPQDFNTSDPYTFNRYAYGNSNPYKYTDPDGRSPDKRADNFAEVGVLIGELTGLIDKKTAEGWRASLSDGKVRPSTPNSAAKGDSNKGCLYCVSGKNTKSGKDYVGSTNDMSRREKDLSEGRGRRGAEIVDSYDKSNKEERRQEEQQAINERGGVGKLDNKRNEIAPNKWEEKGVSVSAKNTRSD